jgi:hypothetical protein
MLPVLPNNHNNGEKRRDALVRLSAIPWRGITEAAHGIS